MRKATVPKGSRKIKRNRSWKKYLRKCRQVVYIDRRTDALGVIDASKTFMPGGGLPVPFGHLIIPVILGIVMYFDLMFASQDLHPWGHISLASSYIGLDPYTFLTYEMVKDWEESDHRLAPHAKFTLHQLKRYLKRVGGQMLWTDHGMLEPVTGAVTEEAKIHPQLCGLPFFHIQTKGLDPACDSYSAFFDNLGRSTGLRKQLRKAQNKIRRIFFVGLALDYCVGWTALAAAKLGYEVYIIRDGTRSVARKSELAMLAKLREAGIIVINANQLRHAA